MSGGGENEDRVQKGKDLRFTGPSSQNAKRAAAFFKSMCFVLSVCFFLPNTELFSNKTIQSIFIGRVLMEQSKVGCRYTTER